MPFSVSFRSPWCGRRHWPDREDLPFFFWPFLPLGNFSFYASAVRREKAFQRGADFWLFHPFPSPFCIVLAAPLTITGRFCPAEILPPSTSFHHSPYSSPLLMPLFFFLVTMTKLRIIAICLGRSGASLLVFCGPFTLYIVWILMRQTTAIGSSPFRFFFRGPPPFASWR